MTRRYLLFVLLMAVLAGGLRLWADLDQSTLPDRFPRMGHASLWYCPLGRTIGYAVNMPVIIISQLVLPRSLPYSVWKARSLVWWSAEIAICMAEASLAALFWILVGKLRRIQATTQRYRLPVVVATGLTIIFGVLGLSAVYGAFQNYRRFLGVFPQPADWVGYIRGSRFSDDSLVAPTVIMLFGFWCLGAAACMLPFVLRQFRLATK